MENVNEPEVIDDAQSFLDVELEALKSIYVNELKVDADIDSTTVSIDLYPATADNIDEQYVRMTLQFLLSSEYPEDVPKIQIRNPRGLSEEKLNSITKELLTIAEANEGNSMLYGMIEAAKEHLTTGNRPCGECAICLHGFSESDVFTKTECYHYFHSHCLARYAKNFAESAKDEEDPKSTSYELLCPMCREPITFKGCEEEYPPPEASDDSQFELTDEMVELQSSMAELFQKQVENGGIIDLEAEKNKFLLEISNVAPKVSNGEKQEGKASISMSQDSEPTNIAQAPETDPDEHSDSVMKKNSEIQSHDNDARGKDYKQQNASRRNYDQRDKRFNRQPYNQGSNYRGKYDRYDRRRYPRDNVAQWKNPKGEEDGTAASADVESNDVPVSPSPIDDGGVAFEGQRRGNKYKTRFSPRHHRGYSQRGNYNNHYDGRMKSERYAYRRKPNEFERDNDPTNEEGTANPEDHDQGRGQRRGNFNRHYDGRMKTERHDYPRRQQRAYEPEKNNSSANEEGTVVPEDPDQERSHQRGNFNRHYDGRMKPDRQSYLRKHSSNESEKDNSPTNDEEGAVISEDHDQGRDHRRGNFNRYYDGRMKPDRRGYLQKQSSNESDKDNAPTNEEDGSVIPEDRHQGESTSHDGFRKNNYRNNRPNFEHNGERSPYNRNAQRGARRGYGRQNNYFNDSRPFVKDRQRDSGPRQAYSERNRNFQGRDNPWGSRRTDDASDSYRPQNRRNAHNEYPEEPSSHPENSKNVESHDVDSGPKIDSDPNHGENIEQVSLSPDSCQKSSVHKSSIKSEQKLPKFNQMCSSETLEKPQAKNGAGIAPMMKDNFGSFRNVANPQMCTGETLEKPQAKNGAGIPPMMKENFGSFRSMVNPPPGFANPLKKVIYGLESAKPPPGFNRS